MKTFRFVLIQIIVILLLVELVFRGFGYHPYFIQKYSLVSEPSGYMLPDEQNGFRLGDGVFRVTINDSVFYTVTHRNGTRSTHFDTTTIDANLPKIALIGGSFNYGMGVDDTLAYPTLLQKANIDKYQIDNLCIPGYGTHQAIEYFKNQPDVEDYKTVILHYASFHDERNVLTPDYRVALHHGFLNSTDDIRAKYKKARYPYFDIQKMKSSHIRMDKLYRNWWFREYSGTVNFFQSYFEQKNPTYNIYRTIPEKLILDFYENFCKKNNIQLIVATISNDEQTKHIQNFCRENAISTVNLFVDYTQQQYSNLPYDSHPNDKAHQVYFEKMNAFLSDL